MTYGTRENGPLVFIGIFDMSKFDYQVVCGVRTRDLRRRHQQVPWTVLAGHVTIKLQL